MELHNIGAHVGGKDLIVCDINVMHAGRLGKEKEEETLEEQ